MLVEHERKYVQWLQRNKIITDPFKTHKLQERYGKNISEKRGMLINWETKRKKKKRKRQYWIWRNKNSKAGFFFEKQFLLFARKGIIFHTILADWSVTNNLDKSLIPSHRFDHGRDTCARVIREKTIAPGRNAGGSIRKAITSLER